MTRLFCIDDGGQVFAGCLEETARLGAIACTAQWVGLGCSFDAIGAGQGIIEETYHIDENDPQN